MSNWLKDLNEALKTIRHTQVTNIAVQYDDSVPVVGTELNDAELLALIAKIKDTTKTRDEKLNDYRYMEKDAIVGGALDLIADESTLLDDIMEMPYWVESKNKDFEKFFNSWLKDTVDINRRAWLFAYRMTRDGEVILRTYDSITDKHSVDKLMKKAIDIGDYFELVDRVNDVGHLTLYDNTIGYQLSDREEAFNDKIFDDTEFIHVFRDTGERDKVKLRYIYKKEEIEREFKIAYGTSFLEDARQAFLILDLLDTLVLSQRINKNQVLRIIGIEVGNASPKDTRRMVSEVKSAFKQTAFEKEKLYKEGNKSSTISNVYVPTRQDKGNINVQEIGGNIDVKDLTDLDYYTNKLFAALRVPKEFLGFDSSGGGALVDGSMTKKDLRFARLIKSVKALVCDLVREMVLFKMSKTKYANQNIEFEVKSTRVATSEDDELVTNLQNSLIAAEALKTFLTENEHVDNDMFIEYALENILHLPKWEDFYKINKEIPEEDRIQLDTVTQTEVDSTKANIEMTKQSTENLKNFQNPNEQPQEKEEEK